MPAKKRQKPLYQRGKYALHSRAGRANLEVIWYDDELKRERSASAGTSDLQAGIKALDRIYLNDAGERLCPTCQRPWEGEYSPLVSQAIGDYLILREGSAGHDASRHRLSHVIDYLAATKPETHCAEIDEAWIVKFRAWALARPVVSPKGRVLRDRSLAHVEGSVMQLAAAINAVPGQRAKFTAQQQVNVTQSPKLRVPVETIAAMFNYCLRPEEKSDALIALRIKERQTLLAYLRLAVASWARPETVLAVRSDQWHSAAHVLDLNPVRRQRTNKRLPMVPIAKQMRPWLDELEGNWIQAASVRASWDKLRAHLKLPANREAGPKLIRRSISTIARKRIGEAQWRQGEIMLGHVPFAMSDIYAIIDPANLGLAMAATEEIIDEIEALAPGAYRNVTASAPRLKLVGGDRNG
ncbi:MAG: hypothetical protein J7498_05345 [Sphingobium sp.]|nr:hypothetical protein [Sphingobium sp.]